MRRPCPAEDVPLWPHGTLLSRLDPNAQAGLLALGTIRSTATGAVLLRQGAHETHVILLRQGFVKVSCSTSDGHEAMLAVRVAGDLMGEISALNAQPRSATVVACTPTLISVIGLADLQGFLARQPRAALELAGMVAERLRTANEIRVDFTSCPIPVRLAKVLVKAAMTYGRREPTGIVIGIRLTQTELASLCGAAEVTIQKTLRWLRNEGLILTGYRHIVVTDLPRLRAVAGTPGGSSGWADDPTT